LLAVVAFSRIIDLKSEEIVSLSNVLQLKKKGRSLLGHDLFSTKNKLLVKLRRCGVAGRKTRVGQRCALPWYQLGPIQKIGPPAGIYDLEV
jgi:hypothetical protein|tara:strand:+ start:171 stop:443 length:273 start_codon:yes stop_codon:yes gene_type:complete